MIEWQKLKHWFLQNRRKFPWRVNPTPYKVWISEVMLQQTQAHRVVSYFERWMKRFPDVYALARSSEEEVCKLWEGLGYYSRARALLQSARQIVTEFQGVLPSDREQLSTLKGLGPYTTAAILAFGFHQRSAPLDANVERVLTRFFGLYDDISSLRTKIALRERLFELLPDKESWTYAEALIELGATVCTKKAPECVSCPLQNGCVAFAEKLQDDLPVKTQKIQYEKLYRDVAVIVHDNTLLLRKELPKTIMAGLYQFPYFETTKGGLSSKEVEGRLRREFDIRPQFIERLEIVKHSFTRFDVTLYPKLFQLDRASLVTGYEWHEISKKEALPFSSGHKRIIENLDLSILDTCNKL